MKLGDELKCALNHVLQTGTQAGKCFSLTKSLGSLHSLGLLGSLVTGGLEVSVTFQGLKICSHSGITLIIHKYHNKMTKASLKFIIIALFKMQTPRCDQMCKGDFYGEQKWKAKAEKEMRMEMLREVLGVWWGEAGQEKIKITQLHLQCPSAGVLTNPGQCVQAHLAHQRSPLDGGRD